MKDDIVKQPAEELPSQQQPSVTPKPMADVVRPKSPAQTSTPEPVQATQEQSAQPQPQEAPKPKRKKNVIPIIIAIIVLLGLVGVAVYAGMQSGKKDNNKSGINTQTGSESNPQQVNQAANDIDTLPADEDTSGDGLTDANLGL